MELPFQLETDLERRICQDPEWKQGALLGKPRPGHNEGQVIYHIAEVLTNVDRHASSQQERGDLRLIALIHDTFKCRIDPTKPKAGENHHAMIARRFAERYLDQQLAYGRAERPVEGGGGASRPVDWATGEIALALCAFFPCG